MKQDGKEVVAVVTVTTDAAAGLEGITYGLDEMLGSSRHSRQLTAVYTLEQEIDAQRYAWRTYLKRTSLKDHIGELLEMILTDMPEAAQEDIENGALDLDANYNDLVESKRTWKSIVEKAAVIKKLCT